MPVNPDVIGREFLAPEPFVVLAERVQSFNSVLQRSASSVPVTFPITASLSAMEALAFDPEVGIDWARVVHGDQKFEYLAPLEVGMSLQVRTIVESVKAIAGNEIVGVRSFFSNGDKTVLTTWATIVVRGEK